MVSSQQSPQRSTHGTLVFVASPFADIRARWRESLRPGFIVAEATRLSELRSVLDQSPPAVLVLDLAFSQLRYPHAAGTVRGFVTRTKVLAIAHVQRYEEAASLIACGAIGYCERTITPDLLRKAVNTVLNDEVWISRTLATGLLTRFLQGRFREAGVAPEALIGLSARERQVAQLIASGARNKDIAWSLEVSEATVKAHVTSVFRKLHVSDRVQLALSLNSVHWPPASAA